MRFPILPLVLLVAAAGAAQTPVLPQVKLQRGFAALSQGSWSQALAEWNQDGTLGEERLEEARALLERLVGQPRTVGEWGPVRAPLVQRLWQRHWALATFDRSAVFLAADFVLHRGEWRLLRLSASQDPKDLLPNLDLDATPRDRN